MVYILKFSVGNTVGIVQFFCAWNVVFDIWLKWYISIYKSIKDKQNNWFIIIDTDKVCVYHVSYTKFYYIYSIRNKV